MVQFSRIFSVNYVFFESGGIEAQMHITQILNLCVYAAVRRGMAAVQSFLFQFAGCDKDVSFVTGDTLKDL